MSSLGIKVRHRNANLHHENWKNNAKVMLLQFKICDLTNLDRVHINKVWFWKKKFNLPCNSSIVDCEALFASTQPFEEKISIDYTKVLSVQICSFPLKRPMHFLIKVFWKPSFNNFNSSASTYVVVVLDIYYI